jgi:hypothetical protein
MLEKQQKNENNIQFSPSERMKMFDLVAIVIKSFTYVRWHFNSVVFVLVCQRLVFNFVEMKSSPKHSSGHFTTIHITFIGMYLCKNANITITHWPIQA